MVVIFTTVMVWSMGMIEPTVSMQLGISDDRYHIAVREIDSILKTKETIGNMMLMVQSSGKLSEEEKLYAAFLVGKEYVQRKLIEKMPPIGRGVIQKLLEE